jgi:hypothetical protein
MLLLLTVAALGQQLDDDNAVPLDHPAIRYRDKAPNDAISKLEASHPKLAYASNGLGYLPALLKALNINVDSQALVFSKTSTQVSHINPRTPRAIYFNDEVSVGYVQGSDVLEFAALDPTQGVKLYSLDVEQAKTIEFARRDDCLLCHQGAATLNIPGMLIASVRPSSVGRDRHGNSFVTDHRSPIGDRWGGWYVTGTTGMMHHLGNNVGLWDPLHPGPPTGEETQNVTSLEGRFDVSKYLAPTSDVVALMVLEHQTRMTNLLVRIGWDARIAEHDGKPASSLNDEIEELVSYMLFADEAVLTSPVKGVSTFSKTFPERGPKDKQGRSLRDLDLNTRLFRYPLSYMIYSPTFDALPEAAKSRIYQRLWEVLSGKEQSKTYARLSAEDRQAILGIVRGTKVGLPGYWSSN